MAKGYGDEHSYTQNGYTFHWETLVDYNITSETPTQVAYSVAVKVYHIHNDESKHVSLASGITASLTVDGTEVATVTTPDTHQLYAGEGNAWTILTHTGTFNKVHGSTPFSADSRPKIKALTATIKLNNWGKATSTYENAEAFTVPATTRYNVGFLGNGATLWSRETVRYKWHDEPLTIPNSLGTRTNYEFTGYNTAADGSGTSYAPGASYTDNVAATMYAQWELATIPAKVKVNGVWKNAIVQNKAGGAWKVPHVGYIKVGGTWKQIT